MKEINNKNFTKNIENVLLTKQVKIFLYLYANKFDSLWPLEGEDEITQINNMIKNIRSEQIYDDNIFIIKEGSTLNPTVGTYDHAEALVKLGSELNKIKRITTVLKLKNIKIELESADAKVELQRNMSVLLSLDNVEKWFVVFTKEIFELEQDQYKNYLITKITQTESVDNLPIEIDSIVGDLHNVVVLC